MIAHVDIDAETQSSTRMNWEKHDPLPPPARSLPRIISNEDLVHHSDSTSGLE